MKQDVRMRGFTERTTVQVACEWVDAHAQLLDSEMVCLDDAHGRLLVKEIVSPCNIPAFERSAMDGYALLGAETTGANNYNPITFKIVGEALPGIPCSAPIQKDEAVRIMTGAPLPITADAVLPAEYAEEKENKVCITATVSPGKHVMQIGEDIAVGESLFSKGRLLRPQDVSVLASLGIPNVEVTRQPRVRLIITGDELAQPGKQKKDYQIYESNSYLLQGLIKRDGGLIESVQFIKDDPELIKQAMTSTGADIILVSGGSSVGQEDYAPVVLAAVGELAIHGIAMRPSSPAGMGSIGKRLLFLLPGNPVSSLCAYDFFAGRAIRQLQGKPVEMPYIQQTKTVGKKIVSAIGRVDYCRVILNADDKVQPLAVGGASSLSSTSRADGFVIIPAPLEGYGTEETVTIYMYDR